MVGSDILDDLAAAEGSYVADINELAVCLLEEMGGAPALAVKIKETFEETTLGGTIRANMLKQIMDIIDRAQRMNAEMGELNNPDDMSDEELWADAMYLLGRKKEDAVQATSPAEA